MSVLPLPTKSRFKPESAEWLTGFLPNAQCDIQKQAQKQLIAQGLPTQKLETWGFTNLNRALKSLPSLELRSPVISIQNTEVSKILMPWALALLPACNDSEPSLRMMSYALMDDIYVIDIAPNENLTAPIIIDWSLMGLVAAQIIIRVQKNSSILVEEKYAGEAGLRLGHVVFDLAENARVIHTRQMHDAHDSVELNTLDIFTARNAVYEGFILNTGGKLSRTEIYGQLRGEGSEISLNGLQLQRDAQCADTTILLEHFAPHCRSNQFYKTILKDQATGIFQGKIFVDQKAQKTDGYQMSNGILLSEGTTMQTKPQLEIYADDVKCSHGTTTGQLDETPLFYLCSRGLTEVDARRLLLQSACGDVIEKISQDELKEKITQSTKEWLDGLYDD